jgi:protein involved in polysaccharide export with SLBB domain
MVFLSGASPLTGQTKQDMQLPELLFGKSDLKSATRSQLEFKDIPTDGPVNPDEYHVGPGDGVVLDVWSSAPVEHQLTVTPEGYLLLPSVGAVPVQNLTLKEAREKVVALEARRYPGATITLTLVSPRKVSVEITGQVMNEGMQEVYSVQRVSALLEQANNLPATQLTKKFYDTDKQELRRAASQRYIVVRHRDGTSQRVDLVKYALTGIGGYNPYLREGDNVFVPGRLDVDNRLGVFGGVVKNISVEYAPGDSITDLLQLGLGLSPLAVPETATLMRQSLDGRVMDSVAVNLRAIAEKRSPNIALQPGDRLMVPQGHEERAGGVVTVEGEVLRPGKYPITRNTTRLSRVIGEAGGFTGEANIRQATMFRSKTSEAEIPRALEEERLLTSRSSMPSDSLYFLMETELRLKGEVVSVDFHRLFVEGDSTQDVTLRNYDRIVVPNLTRTVYVFGQVVKPGHIPYVEGRRASSYIDLAGGFAGEARSGDVKVIKGTTRTWLDPGETSIEDGDYIFVPKEVHYPFAYYLTTFTQFAGIIASLATVILVVRNLK